jgi:hypothetical protein
VEGEREGVEIKSPLSLDSQSFWFVTKTYMKQKEMEKT